MRLTIELYVQDQTSGRDRMVRTKPNHEVYVIQLFIHRTNT